MKLAVLAIAVLALTGCKTTSINGQHITDYGDGVEIPERARPNEATKRYYLRAQNYWMRTNIRRGRGYRIAPRGMPSRSEPKPIHRAKNFRKSLRQALYSVTSITTMVSSNTMVCQYRDGSKQALTTILISLPIQQGRVLRPTSSDMPFVTATSNRLTSWLTGRY